MQSKPRQEPCPDAIFAARSTDEIIAVMQHEEEASRCKKILQTMTPACRDKLQFVDNWLRKEVAHTLRSRYELGLHVQELYEDEKDNGGKIYGKNAIGRICALLRWDDGLIRLSLRFVQTFSPEELEHLCARVMPGGELLTWSHVRVLLTVDDAVRRRELLDNTVAEGWTCTDLAHQVKGSQHRAEEQRGRPPRVPRDLDDALALQRQAAVEWDRRFTRAWTTPKRSLLTYAATVATEEITVERLHKAGELALQLRRVAIQAIAQAEQAERVVRDFERILNQREKSEKLNQLAIAGSATAGVGHSIKEYESGDGTTW